MINLLIDVNNYSTVYLNNAIYTTGGNYGCNYPVKQTWIGNVIANAGSTLLESSGGTNNFLDLLELSGPINTNQPTFKWIVCETGEVFEIDYIIDENFAVLKVASGYTTGGAVAWVVDYWAQSVVASTSVIDISSGGFGVPAVNLSTKNGIVAIDVSPDQDFPVGTEPLLLEFVGSAGTCAFSVMFEQYNI